MNWVTLGKNFLATWLGYRSQETVINKLQARVTVLEEALTEVAFITDDLEFETNVTTLAAVVESAHNSAVAALENGGTK